MRWKCVTSMSFAEFTAAPLAIELARTAPDRVHRLILDGVFILTASERRALRKPYCPAITPRHDGTHVVALWQRLRDQELSWPWYDADRIAVRRRTPEIDASSPARDVGRCHEAADPLW